MKIKIIIFVVMFIILIWENMSSKYYNKESIRPGSLLIASLSLSNNFMLSIPTSIFVLFIWIFLISCKHANNDFVSVEDGILKKIECKYANFINNPMCFSIKKLVLKNKFFFYYVLPLILAIIFHILILSLVHKNNILIILYQVLSVISLSTISSCLLYLIIYIVKYVFLKIKYRNNSDDIVVSGMLLIALPYLSLIMM